MAEKNVHQKSQTGYFSCPVCYDLYLNPKYLLCYHTYCEMCLEKIQVGSDLTCKKCGGVTPIPVGGVKELPDNFLFSRVADRVKFKSKLMSDEAKCDHCATKESTATAVCFDCGTVLCEHCYDYHKNSKEYQGHSMVPLGEVRGKPITNFDVKPKTKPAMCHEHSIELNFYCGSCEQLVCHYCITKYHLSHDHNTVKKMVGKHRKELDKSMEPVQDMIDGLSTAHKTGKVAVDKIDSQANDINKDIGKHYELLSQLLQRQRECLRKQVQEELMQKKNTALVHLEKLEDIQTELRSLKELDDEIKKRGSDQETLLMKKCVMDDMKRLNNHYKKIDNKPVNTATVQFMPIKEYEKLFPVFGMVYTAGYELADIPKYAFARQEIELKIIDKSSDKKRGQIVVEVQTSRRDIIPVKVTDDDSNEKYLVSFVANRVGVITVSATVNGRHIKGSPSSIAVHRNYCATSLPSKIINDGGNMGSPWGIAINRDGTWAVSDSNHCVWVFASNDLFVTKFGQLGDGDGQFNKPHGVAFDDDDNLYVTDHSNHRVQKFTKDGKYLCQFGSHGSAKGQLHFPVGIVVYNGYAYVVDHGNSRLSVFQSSSGQFCRIIKDGPICNPYYVTVSSKGELLVTDNTLLCILIFNVNGKYMDKYGMSGVERGHMGNPIGLATDVHGFIFVCEFGKHRVSIFDEDGAFIHCFGSNGSSAGQFKSPYGMAFSPNGSIYVCDYGNKRIQVFSFL